MHKLVFAAIIAFAAMIMGAERMALAVDQPFPPTNPWAGNAEAIEAGRDTYWKFCVGCHGRKADGVSRFGEYAGDLTKFWRGYCNFVMIVLNGRPQKQMPPWGGYLDEQQIGEVGAYLETLQVEGARWAGKCTQGNI